MQSPYFDKNLLLDASSFFGYQLNDIQLSLFEKYFFLLNEWNGYVNLISRNDLSRFVSYHILDSLKLSSIIDFSVFSNVCDFGSGSGIPGIPLSIVHPSISFSLLESRKKRCDFLNHCISNLPLFNCSLFCEKAEHFILNQEPVFDAIITRATCSLSDFFLLFNGCLSPGGVLISIKGNIDIPERNALFEIVPPNLFSVSILKPQEYFPVRTGNIVLISRL